MAIETEKIIESLKNISQASLINRINLVEQFRLDFPNDTDWLEMFAEDNQSNDEVYQGKFPQIDGFKIIRSLGSGANGKVFLAIQNKQQRQVAIKIPMQFLSQEQLQRFAHESRMLARLSHNNIAQLFESGYIEKDQLPYIVMEHINGVTIQRYCHDNKLESKQIILLFYQVLEAVQYAHNRGIVHRDIKPENILVNNDGVVKLLDFGIALATENSTQHLTQLTKTGEIVGTLAYMSPEQVSGVNNIDTRADVYSLGVVLYQLLSNALPHKLDANQIFLAISKIIEDLPKKLTAQNSEIDGDLANIVHHAIEKNPDHRYQSPRDFKNDLNNYLAGKAISVKNNTLWQNLKYISRKHKALVSGSLLAVLGLITGLVFAVSFALKEQQARKIAETNAKTSAHTANFINEILISADPDNIFGEQLTVLQVIDNAEATIQSELKNEETVEANIRTTLANVYNNLGQSTKAQNQIDKVESLLENLKQMEDYSDFNFAIKFIQSKLYLAQNNSDENIVLLQQLLISTKNHPINNYKTMVALSNVYITSGNVTKAQELINKVLNTKLPLDNTEAAEAQLFAQNSYALLLTKTGEFIKAKEILEKLLETRTKLYGKQHVQTLSILNSLAAIESNLGNLASAQKLTEEVIINRVELLGETHLSTLISKANLLTILITSEQLEKADQYSLALMSEMNESIGSLNPRTLEVRNMRAYLLEDMGNASQAEKLYRSTLQAYAEKGILKGPELFALQNNLAMLLMNQEKLPESNYIFSQLLANVKESLGQEHIYYAIFIGNYGELLLKQNEIVQAKPLLQKSYEKLAATFGENHKRTLKAQKRLEQLANYE